MDNAPQTSTKKQRSRLFHNRNTSVTLNYRYFILSLSFAICAIFYYFGELAKYFRWVRLEWNYFYGIHDVHRLLFLGPILFAAFYCGATTTLVVSMASLLVFLPRAILFSPFPDPIARAVAFGVVEGAVGMVVVNLRRVPQWTSAVLAQNPDAVDLIDIPSNKGEAEGFAVRNLRFNLDARVVKRNGQVMKLTRTEYKLLVYLVNNRGKVLSHKEILGNVWGGEYGNESEYLRTFISQLRKKVEDDPANPQLILTEQGIGYRFIET